MPHAVKAGSRGIDISEHNGSVNFKKVKGAGYDFVIVRAAYIGPGNKQKVDSLFTTQRVKEIRDADLVMGVYMYTVPRHGARGWDDFKFLYEVLHRVSKGLRGGLDLKLIADVEESDLDGAGNAQWMQDWADQGSRQGVGAIGYSDLSFPFSRKVNVPCWVANPGARPGAPNGICQFASSSAIHQYSFTARVNGVSTPCDANIVTNPAHITLPHAARPVPKPPNPKPKPPPPPPPIVVDNRTARTAKDVQQRMWLFLRNRGYKVSTVGGGGLAVDNKWGKQSRLAKAECQWRLGYPEDAIGSKVDDRFMDALLHPKRFLNPAIRPGYVSRAAARAAHHKFFDLVTTVSGDFGTWQGVTVSSFIYNANVRVQKLTNVVAMISDFVYGGFRTHTKQGVLRAIYVNSGYDPRFIAAAVGMSRHERRGPKEGAEDLSNPSDFDAACRRSSTRPPYRYNYNGDGDIVHISDNAG